MSGFTVEVSARKISAPYLCPCCCGVADTELAVSCTRVSGESFVRKTTRSFDFPYCSRCVEHSGRWDAAWRSTGWIAAAGLAAAGLAALAGGPFAGAGVAVLAAGVAIVVGLARRAGARTACCPSCVGPAVAVSYMGWTEAVHSFSFLSRRYATEFAEHNERRLVDVTAHLQELLEQCGAKLPQPELPTRLPKATLQARPAG